MLAGKKKGNGWNKTKEGKKNGEEGVGRKEKSRVLGKGCHGRRMTYLSWRTFLSLGPADTTSQSPRPSRVGKAVEKSTECDGASKELGELIGRGVALWKPSNFFY